MSNGKGQMNNIDLFTPLNLGELTLPNRMVMAPLTRNRASMPGNVPQAMNITYYAQRATAGLIISEAAQVSPQGIGYPATPGIHSEEQVQGWRAVNDAGQLANPIFLDIVHRLMPYYWMRLLGGTLYLVGMLMFIFNLLKTIRGSDVRATGKSPAPASAA